MPEDWNHRTCERCWFDEVDTRPYYTRPVQVVDPDPGPCCVCGGMTITGIFFRRRPDGVLCLGRHDDWSWSRVQLAQPKSDTDAGIQEEM